MNQTIVTITKGMEEHRINTEKGMMELRNNSTGHHIWLFPDELKKEECEYKSDVRNYPENTKSMKLKLIANTPTLQKSNKERRKRKNK